jgi:glycosyltransferase involved in cell wall biosynthesis
MSLLFVTWDGQATNYLEGLFFPVLGRLSHPAHVLQFTTADNRSIERIGRAAEGFGVGYRPVPVRGGRAAARAGRALLESRTSLRRAVREVDASVVMPRSMLPAGMVLAHLPRHIPVAFEADGLMQDERVDFGVWRANSARYWAARSVEVRTLWRARVVLTRTERAKSILCARAGAGFRRERVFVVPNGKDEDQFCPLGAADREATREELGITRTAFTLVYVGSIGPQYLPEAMFRLFARLKRVRTDAKFLVLTHAVEEARALAEKAGIETADLVLRPAGASEVPRFLGAADAGVALRKNSFSQAAVCPIKVAEYLLCGLPIVATRGVGDLDRQLDDRRAAFLLEDLGDAALDSAVDWLSMARGTESRKLGERMFGLRSAVAGYERALAHAVE